MALRLLLCRNQWKTKNPGILLGSINQRLCHSPPSSTASGTTSVEKILTDIFGDALYKPPKISPELDRKRMYFTDHLGRPVSIPNAHKDDRMKFLSQFAVFMINDTRRRDDSKRLEFVRVVSAKRGATYQINLEAASIDDDDDDDDGRVTKFYEATFAITNVCLKLQSWSELQSPPTTTQSSLD